ncbi:MAG: hypothetical protein NTY69_02095 [Methylococcales bacterium]|nr:hypothetical protein [Methylococcales bacterium]
MATIILRSAKGSPLTILEVDQNFSNLNEAIANAIPNFSSASLIPAGFVGVARSGTDLYVGDGLSIIKVAKTILANDIGTAGQQGFGVGILSSLPSGFSKLTGTEDITSDNYGNYVYSDGSVMVWIPAFYYKFGTGANGLSINQVAKTRGANFFCNSRFIFSALALLSLAHGQAATSTTVCAWYDATGVNNFPKGCNNNAFGDSNDGSLTFVWDGYAATNSNKTGSANVPAKVAHNGQNNGVMDLNGTLWEVNLGLVADATNYYLLKTSVDIKTITSGNTLATDAWGATGITAMYDSLGPTYGAALGSNTSKIMGSATQVLDASLTGLPWAAAGAGIPLVGGVGGTNQFGNDQFYDARPNELCPVSGGGWNYGASGGVWDLGLGSARGSSYDNVGFRSALYL